MCGIVGYLGNRQVTEVLLDCISKLEYIVYDSVGFTLNTGEKLLIKKFKEDYKY